MTRTKKNTAEYYGRFKGAPWFEGISSSSILICGQGGIGSNLTLFLARTGAELVTVDYDDVELHNIAGQLYGKDHVGKSKVDAMAEVVTYLCGETKLTPLNHKIEEDDPTIASMLRAIDVVCVSFDNIAARKIVFELWLKYGKEISLFVDGRMSMEQGNVFAIPKDSSEETISHYRNSCFDDSELPEAQCTMKATTHCGALISALMVSQITNWFNNQVPKVLPREVITQLDFNLPLMLFEQPKVEELCI